MKSEVKYISVNFRHLFSFLFLICGLFFLNKCNGVEGHIDLQDQRATTVNYDYKIDYPDTLSNKALAGAIKRYATAALDRFFKAMPRDTSGLRLSWQLDIKFGQTETARFIGYASNLYRYTGGAHSVQAIQTFVYDKKRAKMIEFKNLFSEPTVLTAIGKYARNKVAKKFYDVKSFAKLDSTVKDRVRKGTAPNFENYSAFLPTGEMHKGSTGVYIYFQPQQVAPYSAGITAIFIPGRVFYRYLAPEYKKVFIQDK